MGLLKGSLAALLTAFGVYLVNENLYTRLPTHIQGGAIDKRFTSVVDAFRKNFVDGWEHDGAALTVYYKGKAVVDVWGGYADRQAARKWDKDTLSITFSTTKAVAALCVAVLVDRGAVSYDDLMTKHWPGFGLHGKGNVTVQMTLSHMAGLPYLDEQITEEAAADHNKMRELLENEKPKFPPGTQSGYHIYTYGWLVDQLIRHVDEKKRGIGQFFREEIALKFDIDYFIGLPQEEQYRVARLSLPSILDRFSEVLTDPRVAKYFMALFRLFQDSLLAKAARNPDWLRAVHQLTVNNPDYHRLEQAAALGIGNARSLAQIFNTLQTGKLISQKTFDKLKKPFINVTDIVMEDRLAKGNGLLYFNVNRAGAEHSFGHTGHGCQQVSYDPTNELTIAYVTNNLKTGLYMLCRTYARLHSSIYDVLEEMANN